MALPTAGLILRLEADDLSGTHSDDDPVATWPDASGEGNDAQQPTGGNQPIYKTGIVNGLPVVRFGGSASAQYFTLPDLYAGATEGEIFIVLAVDNDPPGVEGDTGLWSFNASDFSAHHPWTDGIVYENWGSTARKTTGNPTVDLTTFHSYNVSSAPSNWSNRFNGITFFTTTSNTAAFGTAPQLGHSGFGYYLDGDIACVIAYDHVLSSGDRADVEDYLTTTYFTAGQNVAVGTATETEVALPITPSKPAAIEIGQASEAETALPVTASKPIFMDVGLATETELANPITPTAEKIVDVGTAPETELAQPITPLKVQRITVGQTSETELALGVTIIKPISVDVGTVTEIELALGISPVVLVPGKLQTITCDIAAPSVMCSTASPAIACTIET